MVTQGVKTIILIVQVILVIASIILVVSAQPTVSGCNWNITTNYLTCNGDSSSPCCAVATNFNAITGCVPSLYQKKCTFSGSNSTYCCDSCLQSLAVCVTSPGYQLQTVPAAVPAAAAYSVLGITIFIIVAHIGYTIYLCKKSSPSPLQQELK